MDAGTEAIIRKLQANFKARGRRAAAAAVAGRFLPPPRLTSLPLAPCSAAGCQRRGQPPDHCRGGGALSEGGRRLRGTRCWGREACEASALPAAPTCVLPSGADVLPLLPPLQPCAHRYGLQEQDIAALEDAVRNRLASSKGMSGRAEKLAAKKALFNNDQWARISAYMAFMAREDEARAAAVTRQHKRATAGAMAATAAEAEKRKCVGWVEGVIHGRANSAASSVCSPASLSSTPLHCCYPLVLDGGGLPTAPSSPLSPHRPAGWRSASTRRRSSRWWRQS